MFPTMDCFGRYNKKDRSPCSQKRYDGPFLPHLCLIMCVISNSSVHITFVVAECKGFFKEIPYKKT